MRKLTTEIFIERARNVHNNKYDYSKVKYVDSKTKVCIICPNHGEFWQSPYKHLCGQGCIQCRNTAQAKTTENFIKESREIHGDTYDYSKVKYINAKTKVCIICKEHGEFYQTPEAHTKQKQGCPKCKGFNCTIEEFIKKSKEIHGDKYDYSKVEYINSKTKVCIICPKHGEFYQTPDAHLQGKGCKKCSIEYIANKKRKTLEEFISSAIKVHGKHYDYTKVDYKNCDDKVCIICPKHGEFWQTPQMHLQGQGCPKCRRSRIENEIENFLNENGFTYNAQQKFTWLGNQSLDFYLPQYNIAIECQGKQHFEPIDFYGGEKGFEKTHERDLRKLKKCEEHRVNILYYSNLKREYPYEVLTDLNSLKKKIYEDGKIQGQD